MTERNLTIHNCSALVAGAVVADATIQITDGTITAIDTGVVEPPAGAETMDAGGLLAMPGLINSHTHAAMTLLRGAVEDVPVEAWFNDYVWPIEVNINADDVRLGTTLACAEMIQAGITTFADHYFFADQVAEAVADCGIRANLGMTFFSSQGPEGLDNSIRFAETWHGTLEGRITASIAPHATYTCTNEDLARSADAARRLETRVHLHAAEHLEQTDSSLERLGITPIDVLADTGVLDAGALIAHGCGITEHDIPMLANHADRVGVAHCPKVYLKHGLDPLTPIRALRAAGVPVGLGTDGPAGCNSIDLFESMRLTAMTQKHATRDATWLTTTEALDMAGPGSADTASVNAGRLAIGAKGDVILVDLSGLHCQPLHDPLAALVYSVRASDVRTTIVDGRPLMVDRQLLTIDTSELTAMVARRAPELLMTEPGSAVQTYNP